MGVPGLWDILRPAAKTRSLTDLAIKEGFELNPDGKRGFRLGIDASIWFFHAEYGREGENPVLRTLFFRCAILMRTTFLPIFVFDGPKRPNFKRGKKVNGTSHALVPGMKQIVEAFGFEWRMAPGEAEAELAYLNRTGVIDAVLSDDVDNFLFGATTVIRNASNTLSGNRGNPILNSAGKDDKNHTHIFRIQDINEHPDIRLSHGGMILIGLMSGGDYQQAGLMRCGPTISHGLAKCGFGDSLYHAAISLNREELAEFLVAWRHDLRQELRTNSKGQIGRKQAVLANSIPEHFPDIDVLLSYVRPITSESMGSDNTMLSWSKEPDLVKLAALCEEYFEWGYKESIIKRFKTLIWPRIVLRILRRAVLDLDGQPRSALPVTPRRRQTMNLSGTPSKMIAQHFSSLETPRAHICGSESEERLVIKIHSSRTHVSTDGLLEYRLEIAPKQLVDLTALGIQGKRAPPTVPDEFTSEEDDHDEEEDSRAKKHRKDETIDPETHFRLWMPACMVKLVEPRLVQQFEDIEEQKRLKKLKTATPRVATEKPSKKGKARAVAKPVDDSQDVFSSPPTVTIAKPKKKSQVGSKRRAAVKSFAEESDADLKRVGSSMEKHLGASDSLRAEDKAPTNPFSSSVSSRTGIRDLTKKKTPSLAWIGTNDGLKIFFPVTHSLVKTSAKPHNGGQSTSRVQNSNQPSTNIFGSSKGTMSRPTQPALSEDLHDSDDSSWEEYKPTLWGRKTASPEPWSLSPSKRKAYASSHSDSEPHERIIKSPRKKLGHTFPNTNQRPPSPSPSGSRPSVITVSNEVIEITDSDSDGTSPKPSHLFRAFPPTAARSMGALTASGQSSLKPPTTSKFLLRRAAQPLVSPDIIDLT